jgi:hypothetical protein
MEDSPLTKCRALIKENDVLSSIICGIENQLLMLLHQLLTKPEGLPPWNPESSF